MVVRNTAFFGTHVARFTDTAVLGTACITLALTQGCSGTTEGGQGGGRSNGGESVGSAGRATSGSANGGGPSGGSFAVGPQPSYGGGGGADGGGPVDGSGGAPAPPLMGAAFLDFDCGEDGRLPAPDACAECQATSCATELSAALGGEWSSNAADGPCAPWFNCIQACPCNDQDCYVGCLAHLVDCQEWWRPIDACTIASCQEACSSSDL